MSLSQLIQRVSVAPPDKKKRISCIVGAVVADSASLPLEWIYSDDTMKEIVGDSNPEFWPESKCPFFTLPTGKISCYGDELVSSLTCLAASPDTVQVEKVAETLVAKFGDPESPYQIALAKRADKKYPVAGPWINSGVIQFLANRKEGVSPPGSPTCHDNDGLMVNLPPHLLGSDQADNVSKLLTTDSLALHHLKVQNQIVENYLTGVENPIASAANQWREKLPDISKEIDSVIEAAESGKSLTEIVDGFGKACSLPGSFQGALAALSVCDNFVSAVRRNILAGGDCNARANFLGACFGARDGIEAIPMEWIERVDGIQNIIETAVKVYLR